VQDNDKAVRASARTTVQRLQTVGELSEENKLQIFEVVTHGLVAAEGVPKMSAQFHSSYQEK
jgi:hypothetical protein